MFLYLAAAFQFLIWDIAVLWGRGYDEGGREEELVGEREGKQEHEVN